MSVRARRNLARAVGFGLVLASLSLLAGPGAAGADASGATLQAKGWWWEAQQLPAALPAPPNVEPGQLNVQGSPSDKKGAAFAAVRYAVDAEHTVQSLTLHTASNGDPGVPAVLLACRTGSAWTAADAGAWSAAPKVDDKACINGNRATDGTSWTFAVGPLQVGTVLDVAIVPGVDPTTKAATPFSIVFDAPANDAVGTIGGTPPTVPPATTPPSNNGTTNPGGSGAGSFQPSVTPIATGLPIDKVGQTATAPSAQASTQPGLDTALADAALPKDRDRRIGYVVLAIAAAIGLYARRQDNLIATNGGALPGSDDEPAGLGRFSRPRHGQPPALT
jgi:hypothetical protein